MENHILSGKITKIVKKDRHKDKYLIYIDNLLAFEISETMLIQYGLHKGMIIKKECYPDILEQEKEMQAYHDAIKFLAYKARSEQEVINKMKEKNYSDKTIEKILIKLKSHHYINDEEYALSFVKDKLHLNKIGRVKLKYELNKKGISSNIITKIIDQYVDDEVEYTIAMELAKKKLQSIYKKDTLQVQYRKIGSLLQRRGFQYDLIVKILSELFGF